MREQFVTYEIALALKELGFDKKCFGYYTTIKDYMISTNPKFNPEPHFIGPNWCTEDMSMRFMYVSTPGDRSSTVKNSGFTKAINNVAAPLWQQAIDWFREEHHINFQFWHEEFKPSGWCPQLDFILDDTYEQLDNIYPTYYKAREQAILKAIELCKNK